MILGGFCVTCFCKTCPLLLACYIRLRCKLGVVGTWRQVAFSCSVSSVESEASVVSEVEDNEKKTSNCTSSSLQLAILQWTPILKHSNSRMKNANSWRPFPCKLLPKARILNNTFRYIDDLLALSNPQFTSNISHMYPKELELKKTTEDINRCSYTDISSQL